MKKNIINRLLKNLVQPMQLKKRNIKIIKNKRLNAQ